MSDTPDEGLERAIEAAFAAHRRLGNPNSPSLFSALEAYGAIMNEPRAEAPAGDRVESLQWPDNIVAERHEVSEKWVLWYLDDAQAAKCKTALAADDAFRRERQTDFVKSRDADCKAPGPMIELSQAMTLEERSELLTLMGTAKGYDRMQAALRLIESRYHLIRKK